MIVNYLIAKYLNATNIFTVYDVLWVMSGGGELCG